MFRIKICGIADRADAALVAASGADAVGINFYPLSPRYVEEYPAAEILAALPPTVARVGVFVNSSSAEVRTLASRLRLDYVQIHGDEPPEFLEELEDLAVIRAFRTTDDWQPIVRYLDRLKQLGCMPAALLLDAHEPGQYGGTGTAANWSMIASAQELLAGLPVILAGGLKPNNVARAIATVGPAAVDTASGVETAPGRKSQPLVEAFVTAASEAFAQRVVAADH